MDEQFNTWMDWIWSSRCHALLFTSTQSGNLKWVSGGGINRLRHSRSCWLTAIEKGSIGWTDAIFSGPSVHPRHLVVEVLWQNYFDAIHWWCVSSSGAEGLPAKTSLLVSSRPPDRPTLPLTKVSVHLVLKSLSWRVSILIQTRLRIDRQCPHLHRRIIWCYCLLQPFSFQSSDATGIWIVGSSYGANFVWPST
jgi:hypothetical protein